jgi:cell division protein FtsB
MELSKQIRDIESNLNKINNYIAANHNPGELFSNPSLREQYAREQLNMSKEDEDVFIFVYE